MLVNGELSETLALSDRALHYGDGLFETVLIKDGKPTLWQEHLHRLAQGANILSIPLDRQALQSEADKLLDNHQGLGVLKIILSRGSGGRGYTPPVQARARRILQLHALAQDYFAPCDSGIRAQICQHPVSTNPRLAGLKHLNRLDQVMASQELTEGIGEGLMFDADACLIEGTKSNVFLCEGEGLVTPKLDHSGVEGVMRNKLLEMCAQLGIPAATEKISLERLVNADGLFVCNSVFGIWPVNEVISGHDTLRFTKPGQIDRLQEAIAFILKP